MAETLLLHAGGLMGEGPAASLKKLVEDYERRLIEDALARASGNQRRAPFTSRPMPGMSTMASSTTPAMNRYGA